MVSFYCVGSGGLGTKVVKPPFVDFFAILFLKLGQSYNTASNFAVIFDFCNMKVILVINHNSWEIINIRQATQ